MFFFFLLESKDVPVLMRLFGQKKKRSQTQFQNLLEVPKDGNSGVNRQSATNFFFPVLDVALTCAGGQRGREPKKSNASEQLDSVVFLRSPNGQNNLRSQKIKTTTFGARKSSPAVRGSFRKNRN